LTFPIIIRKCSFLVLTFFIYSFGLNAQTRESLEKDRMNIIEQIDKTSKVLKKTSKNKDATLDDLKLIQSQIKNRKRVIDNINETVNYSLDQIEEKTKKREELERNQIELQADYTHLIQMSYRKLLTENKLVYFLSSDNWDESLKRIRYTRTIENYLQRKLDEIKSNDYHILTTLKEIESEHKLKESLLSEEKTSFSKLEKDEKSKDRLLYKLKGDEKRLKGALIRKRGEREKLNMAIEDIILATMREKSELERKNLEKNRISIELSGDFEKNKNKLPWPVIGGIVVAKYGKQKHPSLKNIYISNNGIDILCSADIVVKAIFKGHVVGTMQIPGNDYMVIMKHGNYYTVYSKLKEVFVSKGDAVLSGHSVGKLSSVPNAKLHFEIWKDKSKVNPEDWLR